MSFVARDPREHLVHRLDEFLDYLPEGEQETLEELSDEELAERVTHYAILTWPARQAVQRYIDAEGANNEWGRLLEVVRPTTALLLTRLRQRVGGQTLNQLLASAEARSALHEEERQEIDLVRRELWIEFWLLQAAELEAHVVEARKDLEAIHQRLQKLERFAERAKDPAALTEKLRSLQRQIYLEGEMLPIEQLDEELRLTIQDLLANEE